MDNLYPNYFVEDDEGIEQPQQNFKSTCEIKEQQLWYCMLKM